MWAWGCIRLKTFVFRAVHDHSSEPTICVSSISCPFGLRARGLQTICVGVLAVIMGQIIIFFAGEANIWVVNKYKPEEFLDSNFVAELDKRGIMRMLYEK